MDDVENVKQDLLKWYVLYKKIPKTNIGNIREKVIGFLKTASSREDLYIELLNDGLFRLMSTRLKLLGLNVDEKAVMVFLLFCESPYQAVMWSQIVRGHMLESGVKVMTVDIAENFVKQGVPDTSNMEILWDLQKQDDGTNLLDRIPK